jgi:hypothetical protein
MIRLSVKTLAKYMTASPAVQRTILRNAKFPAEDEAYAMRLYYREAVDRIEAFHRNNHDTAWMLAKAEDLAQLAALQGGPSRTRLRHNSRAVRQYSQNFGARQFVPQAAYRLRLDVGSVRISSAPDLSVIEAGKQKAIKLHFSSTAPDPDVVKIVSQCMFAAAQGQLANVTGSSVLYLDVARGDEYRGARAGARTMREIEAACETISVLWEAITPRRR